MSRSRFRQRRAAVPARHRRHHQPHRCRHGNGLSFGPGALPVWFAIVEVRLAAAMDAGESGCRHDAAQQTASYRWCAPPRPLSRCSAARTKLAPDAAAPQLRPQPVSCHCCFTLSRKAVVERRQRGTLNRHRRHHLAPGRRQVARGAASATTVRVALLGGGPRCRADAHGS